MPSSAHSHAPAGKAAAGSAGAPANGEATAAGEATADASPAIARRANGATPPATGTAAAARTRPDGDATDVTREGTVGRPMPSDGTADAAATERPLGDRAMRRLLRVQGPPVPGAVFGAQGFMSRSIVVSAVRCTITYLLIPILAPIVGVLNAVDAPLSIALLTFAFVMSIRSLRRFWLADHARRWAYTGLIAVVWVLLAVGVGTDIARLV